MRTQTTYIGIRDPESLKCTIRVDISTDLDAGLSCPLDPRNDLFNHSPDGFQWGYSGSGPAQTSLAILASHFGDEANHPLGLTALGLEAFPSEEDEVMVVAPHEYLALSLHQKFKAQVVARLSTDEWRLTDERINEALLELTGKRKRFLMNEAQPPRLYRATIQHPSGEFSSAIAESREAAVIKLNELVVGTTTTGPVCVAIYTLC
jgi:hypothetical protein